MQKYGSFTVCSFINVSTILYGSIKLRNGESPESYTAEVADAYIHEKYIPSGGYENDIGLLRVSTLYLYVYTIEAHVNNNFHNKYISILVKAVVRV